MNITITPIIWNFHSSCREIYQHCKNPYAKEYARVGYYIENKVAQHAQAYYLLSNISSWRHPHAPAIRAFLKDFIKKGI